MDGTPDTADFSLFLEMVRSHPVRTCIFSFGLPIFALIQVVNGYLNQAHLGILLAFTAVAMAYSVTLTRYQLAVYRRRLLTSQLPQ